MTLAVLGEEPFPLTELPARIEAETGLRPSESTVNSWVYRGVAPRGSAEKLKLETVRVGRRRVTSLAAWRRFCAALTEWEA